MDERKVKEYRFTRVIFGATSSPYILGATLQKHLEKHSEEYPATSAALIADTYVDDIQGGGRDVDEVETFKREATEIFAKAGFTLHKWHSNLQEFESNEEAQESERLGEKHRKTKILGISWDKQGDKLEINFAECVNANKQLTKRKRVSIINSVFDILGWTSPIMISAKLLFGQVCKLKLKWDEALPKEIEKRWNCWIQSLIKNPRLSVPRSVVQVKKSDFELHGFADASKVAVCAAVYVVEYEEEKVISQNLLAAKSRIAPSETSIPRLELVAAHMLAKLQNNIVKALMNERIISTHYWTDSTTVLHWLENKGTWSVFVRNRVNKIKGLKGAN